MAGSELRQSMAKVATSKVKGQAMASALDTAMTNAKGQKAKKKK